MKLNTIFVATCLVLIATTFVSANINSRFIVEFDSNGKAVKNTGKCSVEQWATVAQSIIDGSSTGVGHRYIVEYGPCKRDAFIPNGAKAEGICCDQRTSKVIYTFKKKCTVQAIQKTCFNDGHTTKHNELKVIMYRQCEGCNAGIDGKSDQQTCSPFGYCGKSNPYSNVMPSAQICENFCQPHTSRAVCRPKHIFSELTNNMEAKFSKEERELVAADDDWQELKLRCATECLPTQDGFACVVLSKAAITQMKIANAKK